MSLLFPAQARKVSSWCWKREHTRNQHVETHTNTHTNKRIDTTHKKEGLAQGVVKGVSDWLVRATPFADATLAAHWRTTCFRQNCPPKIYYSSISSALPLLVCSPASRQRNFRFTWWGYGSRVLGRCDHCECLTLVSLVSPLRRPTVAL